jgi:hypothetical protein
MIQVPFGNTMVTRVAPRQSADHYKTYGMSYPVGTHWRKATCEQADCQSFQFGWVTTVDMSTDLGQRQYHYITHDRTRGYTMSSAANLVSFTYPPGTRCFAAADHKVRLERNPLFMVREGDFRGNPRGDEPRVHTTAENWVDDFATHADKLSTQIQKG